MVPFIITNVLMHKFKNEINYYYYYYLNPPYLRMAITHQQQQWNRLKTTLPITKIRVKLLKEAKKKANTLTVVMPKESKMSLNNIE